MTLIFLDIGTKKMKERTKTSNLIVDYYSLTFANLLLFRIRKKSSTFPCITLRTTAKQLKVNEPWYIALLKVGQSIKNLFSLGCVNIYFSQSTLIFFSQSFFNRFKSVGLPHITNIMIH